jgi:hypothetical protein
VLLPDLQQRQQISQGLNESLNICRVKDGREFEPEESGV